jgi:hypothetical protein
MMNNPTDDSTMPYSPSDTPPRRHELAERPLVQRAAIAEMADALTLAGAAEASVTLLADVERHASYLERCAEEAEAVLHGDLSAATRLWLLLREPIDEHPAFPDWITDEVTGDAWDGAPRAVDGDALFRLVAGVVRAANEPSEADEMLGALARLLQPLYHLDVAAVAAERSRQGDHQALDTFVTARLAPQWRASLDRPVEVTATHTPGSAGRPVLDQKRPPFNAAKWRDHVERHTLGIWDKLWPCVGSARKGMSMIDKFGERYTITSLSNPEACAGEVLTIRGSNFGPTGRVYFPSPDPKDPMFPAAGRDPGVLVGVNPTRWTDTEVDVVVPAWATAGDLHLNAYTRHWDPCADIDVYRLGNSILFRGGLASVYQVSLGGVAIDFDEFTPPNLAPGDSVALTYHAGGGPTTRVRIQLVVHGSVVWDRSGLPSGFGGTVLTVPDPTPQEPTRATLVFSATSACGATAPLQIPVWLSVPPHLTIQYIEVTQGVQGDLGDILAGRGMPTVANKDTAVRVHMNCDRGGWYHNKLDKITGSLKVDGKTVFPTNVRNIVPDRGYAGVQGLSDPNVTTSTLNFTIPAAWLTPGTHSLTVKLVCNDPSGKIVVGQTISWTWVAHNPIRVRALYMALYGSDSGMLDYARSALDYLPTPLTDIGIAAPSWFPHTYDLSTDDGWNDLLDDVEDAWDDADEDSGVRWLGIIPASERYLGKPLAHQGISGTPGIAALAMGDRPEVGAHELGHTLGLNHVNLPTGPGQPEGPYDPADNGGFLRRPPFDVRTATAIPLPAGDLMSYFTPIRPGISTWMRLFLNT